MNTEAYSWHTNHGLSLAPPVLARSREANHEAFQSYQSQLANTASHAPSLRLSFAVNPPPPDGFAPPQSAPALYLFFALPTDQICVGSLSLATRLNIQYLNKVKLQISRKQFFI